jgi:hypothetical protein
MNLLQQFGVGVQDSAHPLVFLALFAYCLGQVIVVSGKRQHGFSCSTHPFLAIPLQPRPADDPFRNRNELRCVHRSPPIQPLIDHGGFHLSQARLVSEKVP